LKALRTLILGALSLTVAVSKVSIAQTSTPYAQALARAEQARQLRIMRREELTAASDKLLELAMELKKQVNTDSAGQVSVDSLKVASKIEKLARKLHQWMKE
jgi:hypothetical protein